MAASGPIAIFIDGGYLDKLTLLEHNRARIDIDKLATEMAMGQERHRAYYYHCPRWMPPTNPTLEQKKAYNTQQSFFARIRSMDRFEVRLGILRPRGTDENGNTIFQQKRVDVQLAIDVVRVVLQKNAAMIALLAGDGDYQPLIQVAKDAGVITRLFHGMGTCDECKYSPELHQACDECFPIDAALVSRVKRLD
ncbi:MAG TPA: NYN domain-containing protein [Myxococcota bacterium]|nr:NYN domain-containing protein [Myxococcota bacterium]HRY92243.1 NYN domain-containing protein [Myxococcota bacterium]